MAKTINREELGKVEIILDQELEKAQGEIGVGDAIYLEELLSEIRDKCDQGLQNLKTKQGEYKLWADKLEQEFQLKLKKKKEKFEESMKREKEKHREEKEKWEEETSLLKAKYEAMRWT
ncbi:PREDICTED: uncharacterized protein LOC103334836 [Prunus mume]|uniref:Uncharacterized protein LOC103334836 n=1 Tax=Prunus mume TaxID=102107 RepID=A0ABM0P8W0_PRUMU|nr:PREDICTED: uncharacterized protein LOC103334836 [Prunus mume]